MAYKVTLINGNDTKVIHSPVNPEIKLVSGLVTQSTQFIDSFDFSFNEKNPADAFIKELKTEVEVVDTFDGTVEFEGRIKNRTGTTSVNGLTVKRYTADDALIYLEDSDQYAATYSGPPKGLAELALEHHNAHVEPHKQFVMGLCEIDTYKVYVDEEETGINVALSIGDEATIKPDTKYIWHDNGTRLNISSLVLGVTHTVVAVGSSGVFEGKYRLKHPIEAWGVSGWIQAEDIVETYTTQETQQPTGTDYDVKSTYISGTKVRLKPSTRIYYKSSDGTGPTPIGEYYLNLTYTIGDYISKYDRYSIYHQGEPIAWVNASDLEGGSAPAPSQPLEGNSKFIYKNRTIEAEIDYGQKTLDVFRKYLLEPYKAEIYWEYVEGVKTINIVNRRINETEDRLAFGLNLVSMQENFDPSGVITRLVPLGRKKGDDAGG